MSRPSVRPATPPDRGAVHTVAAGETLFRISKRFGVSLNAIVQANGILNPSLIHPGQQLVIPDASPAPLPTGPLARETEAASASALPMTAPAAPVETILLGVPQDGQDHTLSCELSTAHMLAAWLKGPGNWEQQFLSVLPSSTSAGVNTCNPHRVFRGNVDGNARRDDWYSISCGRGHEAHLGYGVYAEPVAQVMRDFGIDARVSYLNCEQLAGHVRNGRPAIVWFSHLVGQQAVWETEPEDGSSYVLFPGQHVRVVDGVKTQNGRTYFHYLDPLPMHTGSQGWTEAFPHWQEVFGGMAITVWP